MRKSTGWWLLLIVVALAGTVWGIAPVLLCGADGSGDEFIAVDVMPELIYQAQPEYPAKAMAGGIEGKTFITLRVETDGNVSGVKVNKSSGSELLDKAAKAGAEKFRFKPALLNGKPLAVWVSFYVDFILDSEKPDKPFSASFVAVETAPKIITQVQPTYPREAIAGKIQGKVYIKLFVDLSGKVKEAKVAKSSGHKLLDDAALDTAKQFLFEPAKQSDRPVGVWVTLPVSFVID
jgi:TonB family protein